MKTLIFLTIVALVVSVLIWRMRKSQEKATLARREAMELRKKREKEALTPEIDMMWPVIIKPVKGKNTSEKEEVVEEPSMTEIAFTPSEHKVARQGRSN